MGKIINTRTITNETSLDAVNAELANQSLKLDGLTEESKKLKQELKLNNLYNGMASDTLLDSDMFKED